jgi:hypothetical protein
MLRLRFIAALAAAPIVAAATTATPAAAKNCYEDIGCPHERHVSRAEFMRHGCEGLRHFRNSMFQGNGYCFKTPALIRNYGNQNCRYEDQASVPLNSYERANLDRLVAVERAKGCMR